MTKLPTDAARSVLDHEAGGGTSAEEVAAAAAQACAKLSRQFSRLLGVAGVRALVDRSVILVATEFPWLPRGAAGGEPAPWSELRVAMAQQQPEVSIAAFVALWSTVTGLLRRFIGDRLVAGLLREVWPQFFSKEQS